MLRIARIIASHYPHHITQRGNNRVDVFLDDEDKAKYLSLLKVYCERLAVDVWAYCLMTNHIQSWPFQPGMCHCPLHQQDKSSVHTARQPEMQTLRSIVAEPILFDDC